MHDFESLVEVLAARVNMGGTPEEMASDAGNDLLCFVLGNASYHAAHKNPLAQRICVLIGSMKPHLVKWGAN